MEEEKAKVNRMSARINGNDYVLTSDRPRQEMEEIVDFVSQELAKLDDRPRFSKTMQATLTCINITDQLFQSKKLAQGRGEDLKASQDRVKELETEVADLKTRQVDLEETIIQKDEDLKAARDRLKETEKKLLSLAKQYQEYQRSHR